VPLLKDLAALAMAARVARLSADAALGVELVHAVAQFADAHFAISSHSLN